MGNLKSPELISAFESACNEVMSSPSTDAHTSHAQTFAQTLAEVANKSAVQKDIDSCCALVEYAVSAFDTVEGTSVMSAVLFEVFEPLQACNCASVSANVAFDTFLGRVAAKCNPQESLTLFLATLGEASE